MNSKSIKVSTSNNHFFTLIHVYTYLYIILCITFTSCTISFQNIDTHGTATDVVDENQDAKADVKTDLSIPAEL